jgi:hypothetical protein
MPDVQGGPGQLRPDNTLNHFTATSGQDIFRGDRPAEELRGNLLFAEPVGRLIRRTLITVEDGVTRLANAYEDQHERIHPRDRSSVPPVNMVTAPDGTLYVVDMYRGIIQQANWTQKARTCVNRSRRHDLQKEIGGAASIACVTRVSTRSATAHARRDSRRVGAAPVPSQWLVARHRAETPRPASRPVGRAGARETS